MIDKRLYALHADICSVFTSSKRLEILDLPRQGEMSVGEIAKRTDLPQSNLSQHLSMLREKGIVKTRREGVTIFYSIANMKIMAAFDIVTQVLCEKLGEAEQLAKDVLKKVKAK